MTIWRASGERYTLLCLTGIIDDLYAISKLFFLCIEPYTTERIVHLIVVIRDFHAVGTAKIQGFTIGTP
ncbi:hypothetical protein N184_38220 [Sinorhizobium sp. GL28]|nr:hypothetical protein N184_38220 [Sinorhizobium sp. GL28]